MKTKNIILYIFTASILLLTSCNDWLDVKSRSQIPESELFATEQGYKDAITGVYIKMAQHSLYGRNTSVYFPEYLASTWVEGDENSLERAFSKFNYGDTQVENFVTEMWKSYYNAIVQINNILDNLKTSTVVFSHGNDKLVKGEALGLRAFLHFELLRYFGPVHNETVVMTDLSIPYVLTKTKETTLLKRLPYEKVLQLIEKDLNDAEKLLENDPITKFTNEELNDGANVNKIKDDWHLYRQNRFNYYAVLGTKARFYHWTNDKALASDYAKRVIEAKNENGTPKFVLAQESTLKDLILFNEHVFCMHNPRLQTFMEPLFIGQNAKLIQNKGDIDVAYEVTSYPSDFRNKRDRYWSEVTHPNRKIYHFWKFTGNSSVKTNNVLVPMLRLPELYFIAVENSDPAAAREYFSTYRKSRGMSEGVENDLNNESTLKLRLEKEYRKEFFGEGQMFFFYKHHNYDQFTWPRTKILPVGAYLIPIPKDQIKFE